MHRLTRWSDEQESYITDEPGKAVEQLARFENLYEHLIRQQEDLPKELEALRREGKMKSYRFREKFGQKLSVEAFLMLMKAFDIE